MSLKELVYIKYFEQSNATHTTNHGALCVVADEEHFISALQENNVRPMLYETKG